MAIAVTVRAERAAAGITQQELAERSGVTYGSVRRIEDGTRVADIAQVNRLAAAFGLTLTEFLRLAESRIPKDGGEVSRSVSPQD